MNFNSIKVRLKLIDKNRDKYKISIKTRFIIFQTDNLQSISSIFDEFVTTKVTKKMAKMSMCDNIFLYSLRQLSINQVIV